MKRYQPLILGHEIVGVVDKVGKDVKSFRPGDRSGVAWLNHACGKCRFCLSDKENLCPQATFTGWDAHGGYAEYTVLDEHFAFHLTENLSFEELAPLMCPGIAGYRALRLTEAHKGERVGLYGFGPTAAYTLQVAKYLGRGVYAITRSQKKIEMWPENSVQTGLAVTKTSHLPSWTQGSSFPRQAIW